MRIQYLLRRIGLALLVTFFLSFLIFYLAQVGFPRALSLCLWENPKAEPQTLEPCILEKNHEWGWGLPYFYVSLCPLSTPDTLGFWRETQAYNPLLAWTHRYGNWNEALKLHLALMEMQEAMQEAEVSPELHEALIQLALDEQLDQFEWKLSKVKEKLPQGFLQDQAEICLERFQKLEANAQPWRSWLPSLRWHGANNQYHRWWQDLWLDGGGRRYVKPDETVGAYLGPRIWKTLPHTLSALFLIFLVGIALGIWAALHPFSKGDRLFATLSFGVEALPVFWVALLLRQFFGDQDVGVGWYQMDGNAPINFILPLLMYTYVGTALMARLMRARLLEIQARDFMKTALAKGLNRRQALLKHGLPHALLLAATLLGSSLPSLVAGSVVIEQVFGIHGIGEAMLNAMRKQDLPVMLAIFNVTALLTLMGYLISDALYLWLNPQVTFDST